MNTNNINFIEEDECPQHMDNLDIPSFKDVYHGCMSREVAIKILKASGKNKAYLIRKRINPEEDDNYHEFILSFLHDNDDYHFKLRQNKKYFIFANRYFQTFKCLICHYMVSFIIKDVCLQHGVVNKSLASVRESLRAENCYLSEPLSNERLKELLYNNGAGSYLFRARTDDTNQFVLMFFDGSRIHKLKMDVSLMQKLNKPTDMTKKIDNQAALDNTNANNNSISIDESDHPVVVIVLGRNYFESWQELIENFTHNPIVPICNTSSNLQQDHLITAVNVNSSNDRIDGDIYRQIKFSKVPFQKDAFSVHGEVHFCEANKKKWKLCYGYVDKDNWQLILKSHKQQPIVVELIKCNFIPIDVSVFQKYCFMLEHKDQKLYYIAMVEPNTSGSHNLCSDKREMSEDTYSYRKYNLLEHDKEVYHSTESDKENDATLCRAYDRWMIAVRRHCSNTKDDVANEENPERHSKLHRYCRRIKLIIEHNSGSDVNLTEADLVSPISSFSASLNNPTSSLISATQPPLSGPTSISTSSSSSLPSVTISSPTSSLPASTSNTNTNTHTNLSSPSNFNQSLTSASSSVNTSLNNPSSSTIPTTSITSSNINPPSTISNNVSNIPAPGLMPPTQQSGQFEVMCRNGRYLIAIIPRNREKSTADILLFHDLPSEINDVSVNLRMKGPKRKEYLKEITRYTISHQELQPNPARKTSQQHNHHQQQQQHPNFSNLLDSTEHSFSSMPGFAPDLPSTITIECNVIIDYKESIILPFTNYTALSKYIMENCKTLFSNEAFFKSLLATVEQKEFKKLLHCFLYMAIWEKKQLDFLFLFIRHDLRGQSSPDLYFRNNNNCIKLFSDYVYQFADDWLVSSFVKFFEEIFLSTDLLTADDSSNNDESNFSEEVQLKCLIALLNGIRDNLHHCPPSLRFLLNMLQTEIQQLNTSQTVSPGVDQDVSNSSTTAQYRLITNFIVFRFFCAVMNSKGERLELFLRQISNAIQKSNEPRLNNFPHNLLQCNRLFKFMMIISKHVLLVFSTKTRPQTQEPEIYKFIEENRSYYLNCTNKKLTCPLSSEEEDELPGRLENESEIICRQSSLSRRFNEVLEYLTRLRDDSANHLPHQTPPISAADYSDIFTPKLNEILDKINKKK